VSISESDYYSQMLDLTVLTNHAGGNCGYLGLRRNVGNLDHMPYGLNISAVSYPLWQDGAGCGACYKVGSSTKKEEA
jgi:hypothetical protein